MRRFIRETRKPLPPGARQARRLGGHNRRMATISEALMMAVVHHTAGRLQAAEQIYRQILAVEPDQADAWHLLGVVAAHTGRPAMAVESHSPGHCISGDQAVFHANLGMRWPVTSRDFDEAGLRQCYMNRALRCTPKGIWMPQCTATSEGLCWRPRPEGPRRPCFASARHQLETSTTPPPVSAALPDSTGLKSTRTLVSCRDDQLPRGQYG